MNRDPRRIAALALAAVLIVGVAAGIVSSVAGNLGSSTVAMHGVIGSEKLPFFQDVRVLAALRRGGFDVSVTTAGSRQIASLDLSAEDFVFPAGAPAAEKIRRERTGTTSIVPFFTPMAIATWKPIVDVLRANDLIIDRAGYEAFDLEAYIRLVEQDTRWRDLRQNSVYPVNKSVLITSTDVRRSNSGAMYLSLASYVANGDSIVTLSGGLDTIVNRTAPLFLRQGFVESSSEGPFEDYLVQGMGKAPMVMIYESQFVARAASADGSITPDMALIYPEPTILSKHTFVSLDANGTRLGQFLATDPELRTLATEYGFRTTDTAAFRAFIEQHQLAVPDTLLNVIDPPTYETLEAMIGQLEQLYTGGSPSPGQASTSPGASP
jgi:hypothetical protein